MSRLLSNPVIIAITVAIRTATATIPYSNKTTALG